jgi:hypothetical protein
VIAVIMTVSGTQLSYVEHRGRGEDREHFVPGNGLAPPDRNHPCQRLAVKRERVGLPLPKAARDRSGIRDELPHADIDRAPAWKSHDQSVPRRTTVGQTSLTS